MLPESHNFLQLLVIIHQKMSDTIAEGTYEVYSYWINLTSQEDELFQCKILDMTSSDED